MNHNGGFLVKNEGECVRNYGIDLLRLLSMFYVVVLHTLSHGGVLEGVTEGTSQYNCAWILEVIAFCAVDIFALISGYVSNSNRNMNKNASKYIMLWTEVVFYGLICIVFVRVIDHDAVGLSDVLKALLPVTTVQYWYFTAYTGLFFFMPALNASVEKRSEKELKLMFVVLVLAFSVFDNMANVFQFNDGYSVIHLVICFLLGRIIKKCNILGSMKTQSIVISIISLYTVTLLWHRFGWEGELLNITINRSSLISYTSPTVLTAAILYVVLFSRLKLSGCFKKAVALLAPHAFAIYLLNDNNYLRASFIKGKFSFLGTRTVFGMMITIVCFSVSFLIISLLIDMARRKLFTFIHVRTMADRIGTKIEGIMIKVIGC